MFIVIHNDVNIPCGAWDLNLSQYGKIIRFIDTYLRPKSKWLHILLIENVDGSGLCLPFRVDSRDTLQHRFLFDSIRMAKIIHRNRRIFLRKQFVSLCFAVACFFTRRWTASYTFTHIDINQWILKLHMAWWTQQLPPQILFNDCMRHLP